MAQIKSYLSLESIPSQQFKTPPAKLNLQTMTTNNSLSFSNTYGSLDNRSGRRALYRSNQLFKNISYQTQDYVQEQDQVENQSAVTLSPAVTPSDIYQVINGLKMIAFLARQSQERHSIIDKKAKAIKEIRDKIYFLEEKVGFQKKQFTKKQKLVKSKSLSISKYRKKASELLDNQIMGIKLEINKMKRTISLHKNKGSIKDNKDFAPKERKIATDRSNRQKIYVPIIPPYANESTYPHIPHTQRTSRKSEYMPFHHNQNNHMYPAKYTKDYSVCYSHDYKHSQKDFVGIGKRTISNDVNFNSIHKNTIESQMGGRKIMDILQEKLLMDFNVNHRSRMTVQSQHNPQVPNNNQTPMQILGLQSKDFRSNADISSKYNNPNIHINLIKQHQREPNLDYLQDNEINDEIRQSQKSRKSSRNPKQAKGLTNTWKKDKQDEQIVQLLKKSISQQRPNFKPPKISQVGAKLIVSNMAAQQSFDYALPEKSRNRDQHIASSSQIQIVVDNSEDRSNSKSLESKKRISAKRENIMNSSIGIVLGDMSDSQDESPVKDNKSRSPNKTSVVKKISIINEALQQSQPMTPVPEDYIRNDVFKLNLEPSIQSRMTETVRHTNLKDAIEMMSSNENLVKKSSEEIQTPPLSRPPSLLQQSQEEVFEEDYDDEMIESIQLSPTSKIIGGPTSSSKLSHKSGIKLSNAQQDDFLGEIRLVTMSKISRQQSEKMQSSSSKNQIQFEDPSIADKMTFSEVAQAPTKLHRSEEDIGLADSQLRQQSRSVIVRKGSAIQKSANRSQSPNLKNSSKSSSNNKAVSGSILTGKSRQLSAPIQQQAQDQQDEFSSIVRKHKRNVTDLN